VGRQEGVKKGGKGENYWRWGRAGRGDRTKGASSWAFVKEMGELGKRQVPAAQLWKRGERKAQQKTRLRGDVPGEDGGIHHDQGVETNLSRKLHATMGQVRFWGQVESGGK